MLYDYWIIFKYLILDPIFRHTPIDVSRCEHIRKHRSNRHIDGLSEQSGSNNRDHRQKDHEWLFNMDVGKKLSSLSAPEIYQCLGRL